MELWQMPQYLWLDFSHSWLLEFAGDADYLFSAMDENHHYPELLTWTILWADQHLRCFQILPPIGTEELTFCQNFSNRRSLNCKFPTDVRNTPEKAWNGGSGRSFFLPQIFLSFVICLCFFCHNSFIHLYGLQSSNQNNISCAFNGLKAYRNWRNHTFVLNTKNALAFYTD